MEYSVYSDRHENPDFQHIKVAKQHVEDWINTLEAMRGTAASAKTLIYLENAANIAMDQLNEMLQEYKVSGQSGIGFEIL